MSTVPVRRLTPEEYLSIERRADVKHEFYRGEMFAMSGASFIQSRIQSNLVHRLNQLLEGSPCQVVGSDMRVCVSATGLYTYPDVVLFCGPPEFVDSQSDTLTNPTVLIEILSDSTEAYDRGEKAKQYRGIASLREYVLVSQSSPLVEVLRRQLDGTWSLSEADTLADSITLESIGGTVPLSQIYARVEFPRNDHSISLNSPR